MVNPYETFISGFVSGDFTGYFLPKFWDVFDNLVVFSWWNMGHPVVATVSLPCLLLYLLYTCFILSLTHPRDLSLNSFCSTFNAPTCSTFNTPSCSAFNRWSLSCHTSSSRLQRSLLTSIPQDGGPPRLHVKWPKQTYVF